MVRQSSMMKRGNLNGFELSQDQNIFYESVRKFAANELADDAVARANSDGYPWDVAKNLEKWACLA